jgi:hypothetical protein
MSLEHDILLAKEWWPRIYENIAKDRQAAVSQGVRQPNNPASYAILSNQVEFSIDNNIYRTEVIRKLGGFPEKCSVHTDASLKSKVESAGFKWIIDPTVVSIHIRFGFRQEASHRYALQRMCRCKNFYSTRYLMRLTLTSPISGFKIALKHRLPQAVFGYPYLRLRILQGLVNH